MPQLDDGWLNLSKHLVVRLAATVKAGSALRAAVRTASRSPLSARARSLPESQVAALSRPEGHLTFVRKLAAARIIAFPGKLVQIWCLQFFRSYFGGKENPDFFFPLTHKYYLSKRFTLKQRLGCAISHYRYERRNSGATYHQFVYRSAGGMLLWHRVVNGTPYSLNLQATDDYRVEGDLSVLCLVDGRRVCRMSFTYVDGLLFGLDSDITMFVTRNQTDRSPDLQRFRHDFKQNSPPYFCLAALCGIAMANGFRSICMIKDDAQVAYGDRYKESFKNSYSALWQAFGAEEIGDRHAYRMTIPIGLIPVTNLKHRSRAVARRQNWLDIMVNARQAILEDRLSRSPAPIDVETSALLPLAIQTGARSDEDNRHR